MLARLGADRRGWAQSGLVRFGIGIEEKEENEEETEGVFGGLEPLHRYNPCKHWLFLRLDPLQSGYKAVTGRYKLTGDFNAETQKTRGSRAGHPNSAETLVREAAPLNISSKEERSPSPQPSPPGEGEPPPDVRHFQRAWHRRLAWDLRRFPKIRGPPSRGK